MRSIPRIERLKAAGLAAENLSDAKIGKILGISPLTARAAIKWAINNKRLLEQKPYVFVSDDLTPDELNEIEQTVAEGNLQLTLEKAIRSYVTRHNNPIIPRVSVIPSGSRRRDERGWEGRLAQFGRRAAETVRQLLGRADRSVGISWGSTVASLIRGLEASGAGPLNRKRPLYFIPLCGEPLGVPISEESCSNLCGRADAVVNRRRGHALSLSAVPALTPIDEFPEEAELEILERLFRRAKHYHEIFIERKVRGQGRARRDSKCWLDDLDTILCSVSRDDKVWGYRADDLLASGLLKQEELCKLVLGDIAGVLIPRPNRWNDPRLGKIQRYWNGVTLHHILACAKRAKTTGTVGVCVFALGSNKAEVLAECLRLRDEENKPTSLINELIVDDDLASRLAQLLGSDAGTSGATASQRGELNGRHR